LDQLANELQTPVEYVTDSRHGGTEAWEKAYLDVAPNSISVLAIKSAEDSGDAMILRLQERAGKQTTAHVESGLLQLSQDVAFRPWEIKTLRVETAKHAKAKVREVSILEV
jgi:alpha-mannosidase